jgi:transcriptional regulator with XRE-family HTH domain
MNIGQRLKELRLEAGLSQIQLAKLMGVTRNAVSQWESGETQPTTKRLASLARTFNVPIDHLIVPTTKVREKIVEQATRLFCRLGYEEASVEVICASAEVSKSDFESLFESKDAVLYEVARDLNNRTLVALRNSPPAYGNLATRLKYLLRHFYISDLSHLKVTSALQSYSWRWEDARERESLRDALEFHHTIIALFDDAAAQGQIGTGNYRAASSLILAAYQLGLRKAVFEHLDPDQLIKLLEPQLSIILSGFGFHTISGFSDLDSKKE